MKDKLLQIRVDEDFCSKLDYLKKINGFKNVAETIRQIIEKEFRINASDKQIPKKPELVGDGYADGEMAYDFWICPNCETYFEIDEVHKYCPNCGQAIDWNE